MKQFITASSILLLAATLGACSSADTESAAAAEPAVAAPAAAPAAPAKPLSAEDAVLVSVTAKIEALNQQTREVSLRGPQGNVVSFVVDPKVQRLNEFKVGDLVTAEYYLSLAAELRAPTAEEKAAPIQAVAGAAKTPPGATPAAGGLRAFKVVATVEGIDLPTRALTLKGPMGNYLTVRARDVNKLKQMKLGDTIVIVYTEALAIGMNKAPAGAQ